MKRGISQVLVTLFFYSLILVKIDLLARMVLLMSECERKIGRPQMLGCSCFSCQIVVLICLLLQLLLLLFEIFMHHGDLQSFVCIG